MALFISLFSVFAIFLIVAGIPLIRGRVQPNGWYGFRTDLTVNNPDLWYPINRYAGWWMVALGIIDLAAALVLPLAPGMGLGNYGLIMAGVLIVGLWIGLIVIWRHSRQLAAKPQ